MHGDMGAWGWAIMLLMSVAWLGLPTLLAVAIWLVARPQRTRAAHLELLEGRYARGEITHEQFEQMKGELA
jgi:uncharacterized membrane protein